MTDNDELRARTEARIEINQQRAFGNEDVARALADIERRARQTGRATPNANELLDVPSPFVNPADNPFKPLGAQRSPEEAAILQELAGRTGYKGGSEAGFSPAAQDTLKEILAVLKEISGKLNQKATYSS